MSIVLSCDYTDMCLENMQARLCFTKKAYKKVKPKINKNDLKLI